MLAINHSLAAWQPGREVTVLDFHACASPRHATHCASYQLTESRVSESHFCNLLTNFLEMGVPLNSLGFAGRFRKVTCIFCHKRQQFHNEINKVLILILFVLGCCNDTADVSYAHATSIFRVEVYTLSNFCSYTELCFDKQWESRGTVK
jgi:hypothetical protein